MRSSSFRSRVMTTWRLAYRDHSPTPGMDFCEDARSNGAFVCRLWPRPFESEQPWIWVRFEALVSMRLQTRVLIPRWRCELHDDKQDGPPQPVSDLQFTAS